jgi:prevent-host-death family protein
MRVVGIRELKASLSETLREVAGGERIRVTSRGRPVADIVPAGAAIADDRLSALVSEGRVVPAAAPRPTRLPALARSKRSASSLVLAERDAER